MYNGTMTITEFKKKTIASIKRNNPDAKRLSMKWVGNPKRVAYRNGITGIRGFIEVSAEGYRTTRMLADWDTASGFMVR